MEWDVGFDLGTENLRSVELERATITDVPALMAYRRGRETPIGGGDNAYRMRGHSCSTIHVERPLRDGMLESPAHAQALLRWAYSHMETVNYRRRFGALITCAPFTRPVQRNALLDAAIEGGATAVGLVRSDVAAALGAGISLTEPEGRLLIDVGAGKLSATLFTLGRPAAYAYLPYGLSRIDERICRTLLLRDGMRIGSEAARTLRHTLGSALPEKADRTATAQVAGFSTVDRLPRRITASADTVLEACSDVVRELTELCRGVLSSAPIELISDLHEGGCLLIGAGATMNGLAEHLSTALGIPCAVPDEPALCAVKGLKRLLDLPDEHPDAYLATRTAASYRARA